MLTGFFVDKCDGGVLTLESALVSKVDVKAARFAANRAAMVALLAGLREQEAVIREGGGAKAAEAQRAKGGLR